MSERRCENCRWWSAGPTGYGYCHKRPPIVSDGDEAFPSTHKSCWCGEWADSSVTPEQEEQKELTRRFAVALINSGYDAKHTWRVAAEFAAAETRVQRENEQ